MQYDERINELERQNRKFKDDAADFKSKADGLIRENDELHANLKRYIEKQQKYTESASLGENSGGNFMHGSLPGADSEAYFELTEMADVLKKANSVLTEQVAVRSIFISHLYPF